MAGKSAILTLKILADARDATKGLDDTAGAADRLQSGVGKAAVPAAAALVALGAAGLKAASAAAEDQAAADQLALALRNSAGASDASIAATEQWISKTSKAAAVADDELRPALATLVRATGDTEQSQKAMGVALDVSAATGKDVESVAGALAKAYAGNTTSLGKLVPGMDKAILASGDMDAIMAELARTTGGAAATAADSAAGKMEGMKIQMAEAEESIGGALLPAMSALAGMLAGVAGWVQDNTQLFLILGGTVAAIAASVLILNAAFKAYAIIQKTITALTKVWTAVQWLLNTAFLSNPITWVVIGIIALIAVIVLIATKTTWFQDIWTAVWGWIVNVATTTWNAILSGANAAIAWLVSVWESLKSAVAAVWEWIQSAIDAVLSVVVGIVKGYISVYVAVWDGIKAGVQAVWDWIRNAVDVVLGIVVGIIRGYIAIYVGVFEGIKSGVGAVWDWLKDAATKALDLILVPVNAVRSAFDKVVDAIRSVIDWLGRIRVPDVLGTIGGLLDSINPFSATASVSSTAPSMAGARGLTALTAGPALTNARSVNTPVIVVQGALDPVAVARQIRDILTADDRRRNGVIVR